MMRRSRISIKPNFKPGSRAGTEGEQSSQMASTADNTLKAEQSHQQSSTIKEPSEDVDLKETPEMPPKINQNDGASSSGAVTSSTAPHRRMRISAAPKLVRAKLGSTPRTQTPASMPSSAPSPLPNEKQVTETSVTVTSVSVISNSLSKSGTPTKSTSTTTETSNTLNQSTSPCVPSTSSLQKSLASKKTAVVDSPRSPQPGQVPQQPPPQEAELSECPSVSDRSLACIKPSQSKTSSSEMSEKSSDKDRILRALKLKELMKIERRKDIQKEKRRVGPKGYTVVDRSQMTMRDLIYYLPNTSPMRFSVEGEENPEEIVIPPSPKEQIKLAEKDDEDEEEEGSENEEMLMPRVRVAEDGSIMLDEDSLTVRVQRSSDTKLVENSATLFERGSTTTYSSFKKPSYVKIWSVRETDLFFLAISMVGTDFTLIGQLLTHRSRAAIKCKFKKEEKVNPWRVDKALRNSQPFDKEFFSYLLEKVLAKDKDKRKSIKLILPKTRKPRRSKGKKPNKKVASDDEEENVDDNVFHMADEDVKDDGSVSLRKESEALSNVKEAAPPAKKRRKRTIDNSKSRDEASCSGEQVKSTRQRKCSKTTREVRSKEDGEAERNLNDESDCLNVNKEDEPKRSTSAPKRGRKHSKEDEEQPNERPVKRRKGKKSLEEESVSKHEGSSIVDDEGSAATKKRKRAKNIDLDGEVPVTGKKKAKRKRAPKQEGTAEEEEEEESSADLQNTEQLNTPATAEVGNNVSPKATKRRKKPLPKLARTRSKKRKVPETSAESEKESQDEENHESILTAADSPLEDERLQMQAVVVLEETPPRQQYLLSPSKIKLKNNELEPSMSSPTSGEGSSSQQSRIRRAGRVKRDLSSSQKAVKRKGLMDQDEAVSVSPMVLLESITREDEDEDNSLNENLIDLSCLRDVDSHVVQRRPMVVLSHEEVDLILNTSEQSAEEDPSASPLDLSFSTELSFPFQCSKLLEDNDDADVDDYMEENEKSTNVEASCELNNFEEPELTESALAQPDMSNLGNNYAPLNLEVCRQPEVGLSKVTMSCSTGEVEPQVHIMAHEDVTVVAAVLDVPPPLVLLENVDPICMKREAPVTQETITSEAATLGTPSVVSDLMKESEKAILPSLPKEESELDSSEITAQSKLTSVGSRFGSRSPLQADGEVKAELQKSLEVPSQTLETLQDVSEGKEDAQGSAMGSPEIKARTQSCAVGLEVTEDSHEEASVQSSASVSTEHSIRPTRRSRFLKPKPNLSQKTRVLQNQRQNLKTPSALKLKSPGPTEKPLYSPANDQHDSFEDFSKQNLNKEKETSPSNAMDRTEFESTKDVSDASTAVTDQENITTASLRPTSIAEPQEASECYSSRRDVDLIPHCTSPQSSQKVEDMGLGQMIVPSEDVCAPAEIVHISDDGHNDEEPTFILTLYEIPVTEADLPSSRYDPVVISDLPKDETPPSLRFSDPAHSCCGNVQTCCEAMHFNVPKSSGSGPSTVDSEKTRKEAQGVSHLVLPDVFVLVSDVKKDISSNDWTVSIKGSPQRASLSEKAVAHFQKELITEDVAQQYVEDLTQSQPPLEETKMPVRKGDKTKPGLQSPQDTSSAQLPTLPQNDNMLLLEEKLQKKHYIVPCSVKLSSLDIVDQSLCASQLGDRRSNERTTLMSSPTCHVSGESSRLSLLGKVALEGPEVKKKFPTRRKDKKTESSPDKKHGHLKPVQTGSQTRQLTITDSVKKRSRQTETNQQEKQPAKSPQKQSSLKVKDVRQLVVEKTCSKSQHADSVEPGGSRLVPSLEETKEVNRASTEAKKLSEMVKELTKDTPVAQAKKSPPKRRAKLQVKPTLAKRVCTESNTSTSDQQQPTRFISPKRQRAQAAKAKEKSENKNKQPVKNATSTSRVEARLKCKGSPPKTSGPLSPESQDVWPKVHVLPRVKLSTPTSSAARVSQSTSEPVTPPQMKSSPTQSSSPAANEHLDQDPARVSQFFLSDIFTEVEEAE